LAQLKPMQKLYWYSNI